MKVTSCDLKLSENSVSAYLSLFIVEPRKERVVLWNFPWSVGAAAAAAEVSYTKRKRGGAPDISKWIAKQSSLANVLRVWMRVCVCACVCESVSRKRESGSCVIGQLRPDRSLTPSRHRDRILHPGQLSHKLLMHEALSFCWRCATVGWWELWVLEGAG